MDIEKLRREAENGDVVSQGILGASYLFGEEIEIDHAEAFRWLSSAAKQGAYLPTTNLAYMYAHGLGTNQDISEAVRLYKKAALRGSYDAAIELAGMYLNGDVASEDPNEVIRWYVVAYGNLDFDPESDEVREEEKYFAKVEDIAEKVIYLLENDPEDLVRARAALVLGNTDDKSAVLALMKATEHASVLVRPHAISALGRFTNWDDNMRPDKTDLTELLLQLSNDADASVRSAAISSIYEGDHNTPKVNQRLWNALLDTDPCVRGKAAYGLAIFKDRELVSRLDDLLRTDPDLSLFYFSAAEESGDPAILPALLVGADRWRELHKDYRHENPVIQSAIERISSNADIESLQE